MTTNDQKGIKLSQGINRVLIRLNIRVGETISQRQQVGAQWNIHEQRMNVFIPGDRYECVARAVQWLQNGGYHDVKACPIPDFPNYVHIIGFCA